MQHFHMTTTQNRKLVIEAESSEQAIAKAQTAGFPYLGTSVYPVTDHYRRAFAGWFTEVR